MITAMSWLFAFLGFAVLIILHEFGHFAAAKAVGMRVERFALFFPPLLFKVRRGETEYGIGAIPLGGYVRITGMNPHEEIPPEVADRAYFRQPVWKRIVVISAGPAMNFLIAFVLLWAIYLSVGTATPTAQIDKLEKGYPAAVGAASATGSWRWMASAARSSRDPRADQHAQVRRHAAKGLQGRHAGRADRRCATATCARSRSRPSTTRMQRAGRTRVGFAFEAIKHDQTAWRRGERGRR